MLNSIIYQEILLTAFLYDSEWGIEDLRYSLTLETIVYKGQDAIKKALETDVSRA